jgi:carboxymethylenebutenolidase
MRSVIVLALVALTAACSGTTTSTPPAENAPAGASTAAKALARSGKIEEFPSQGGNASAYVVAPATAGKHPAIVVIQEWWGLNDWIKDNADRFAEQGYVASAVDLYRGKGTDDPDVAHELMRGLDRDRGIADLKAAIDQLVARPDVDPARIGAIGWCMGGGFALGLSASEPRLKAVVVNYGHLLSSPAAIDAIQPALLGNFAEVDAGIPAADVNAFAATLQQKGKSVDFKVFPGVGHAFMNPNNKKGYDEKAAKEAWARIDAFFASKLKAGS